METDCYPLSASDVLDLQEMAATCGCSISFSSIHDSLSVYISSVDGSKVLPEVSGPILRECFHRVELTLKAVCGTSEICYNVPDNLKFLVDQTP